MLVVKRITIGLLGALGLVLSTHASATMLDLNEYTQHTTEAITVSPDGSSASLSEDAIFAPIALINEALLLPADAYLLRFDYELTVAALNEDYFDFYLEDLTAPLLSVGGKADASDPLIFQDTFTVDVSAHANEYLPMVFALSYGWNDFGLDSVLTIQNLELVHSVMPEPSIFGLMVLSILVMLLTMKRRSL